MADKMTIKYANSTNIDAPVIPFVAKYLMIILVLIVAEVFKDYFKIIINLHNFNKICLTKQPIIYYELKNKTEVLNEQYEVFCYSKITNYNKDRKENDKHKNI